MTNGKTAQETIQIIADTIMAEYRPLKIILFGSFASGQETEDSDIDLLIVKNTDARPIDRWIEVKRLLRDVARGVPVSPLVYTEEEVRNRIAMKDLFLSEIIEKGRALYG